MKNGHDVAATSMFDVRVLILFGCAFLLAGEGPLLSPHLTEVAEEFGMTEEERDEKLGGEIALGLVMLGGPCGLALGLMADRYSRTMLLVVILAFSSVAAFGTAFATNFTTLFWCRALTGLSLGAATPIKFSLLADLFPPSQRIAISGRFSLVGGAGAMAGLALSGFAGRLGWRFPFLVAAALLLVATLVVAACFQEPSRGATDGVKDDDATPWRDLGAIFRTPTVLLLFVQAVLGCLPWGIIVTFLVDYLHVDVGYSIKNATWIMTARSIGALVGHGIGGELGQRIYDWKPRASQWHAALAKVIATPLLVLIFQTPRSPHQMPRLSVIAFSLGLVASQVGLIVHACMANVTAPRARASAIAIHSIFNDLGKGGGPWVVAKIIKRYGRRRTFIWTTVVAWGGAAVVQYLCSFTLEADEAKIRERSGPEVSERGDPEMFADVARRSVKSQVDVESEFLDAANESTSLLSRRDAAPP
mmetsp:Transcript_3252/g.9812  ORF Transcript_3252/g.9812 Transcript_3252/m.9812 type:complete len:475 (-) Transcript_3252:167-1591(-)